MRVLKYPFAKKYFLKTQCSRCKDLRRPLVILPGIIVDLLFQSVFIHLLLNIFDLNDLKSFYFKKARSVNLQQDFYQPVLLLLKVAKSVSNLFFFFAFFLKLLFFSFIFFFGFSLTVRMHTNTYLDKKQTKSTVCLIRANRQLF